MSVRVGDRERLNGSLGWGFILVWCFSRHSSYKANNAQWAFGTAIQELGFL
jgi:hypothetical protein